MAAVSGHGGTLRTGPKGAIILPGGLIMSGNTLCRNIFCYRPGGQALPLLERFVHTQQKRLQRGVALRAADRRRRVQDRQALSGNLLADAAFEEGRPERDAPGWFGRRGRARTVKAGVSRGDSGKRALKIEGVPVRGAKCNSRRGRWSSARKSQRNRAMLRPADRGDESRQGGRAPGTDIEVDVANVLEPEHRRQSAGSGEITSWSFHGQRRAGVQGADEGDPSAVRPAGRRGDRVH